MRVWLKGFVWIVFFLPLAGRADLSVVCPLNSVQFQKPVAKVLRFVQNQTQKGFSQIAKPFEESKKFWSFYQTPKGKKIVDSVLENPFKPMESLLSPEELSCLEKAQIFSEIQNLQETVANHSTFQKTFNPWKIPLWTLETLYQGGRELVFIVVDLKRSQESKYLSPQISEIYQYKPQSQLFQAFQVNGPWPTLRCVPSNLVQGIRANLYSWDFEREFHGLLDLSLLAAPLPKTLAGISKTTQALRISKVPAPGLLNPLPFSPNSFSGLAYATASVPVIQGTGELAKSLVFAVSANGPSSLVLAYSDPAASSAEPSALLPPELAKVPFESPNMSAQAISSIREEVASLMKERTPFVEIQKALVEAFPRFWVSPKVLVARVSGKPFTYFKTADGKYFRGQLVFKPEEVGPLGNPWRMELQQYAPSSGWSHVRPADPIFQQMKDAGLLSKDQAWMRLVWEKTRIGEKIQDLPRQITQGKISSALAKQELVRNRIWFQLSPSPQQVILGRADRGGFFKAKIVFNDGRTFVFSTLDGKTGILKRSLSPSQEITVTSGNSALQSLGEKFWMEGCP